MLKVGFLMPRSTVYPVIGHDFLDGFKSYFDSVDRENTPAIVTHNIGFGIDEADIYSKNEELLLKENVDVVVAFMDSRGAEMIQPLFAATGKILLLVNMGAHYSFESAPGACTINHTFDVGFNSWITGKLAADEQHNRAVFATSYYDAGYVQCFAMATRYLQNADCKIVHNYISHLKKAALTVAPLEEYLAGDSETDALLCLFSGDVSPFIYKEISRMQQQRELHFYVSPMMLDESLQPQLGEELLIRNLKGYTAWHSQIENEENRQFKERFEQFSGRQPGIFGLLGWEAGMITREIDQLKAADTRGIRAVKQIMQMDLPAPRGWLRFDAATQQSYGPNYLLSAGDGFQLTVENVLEDSSEERKKFTAAKPVGDASGWRNTYLCS